jgi:ketopantoate reductase
MSARLIWEGIQVIKANGFKEHELGGIPSWSAIRMSAMLPRSVTSVFYRFAVREDLGLNSTAQDLSVGKTTTELESLNGYVLTLAKKAGLPMPINQAIYEIAKERFGPHFQPMTETELLAAIQKRLQK